MTSIRCLIQHTSARTGVRKSPESEVAVKLTSNESLQESTTPNMNDDGHLLLQNLLPDHTHRLVLKYRAIDQISIQSVMYAHTLVINVCYQQLIFN